VNDRLSAFSPASYPPPPWSFVGQFWSWMVRADDGFIGMPGLVPLLPRWRMIALIRYREGTLRYDELLIGTPVRSARQIGIYVTHIWVDDQISLAGGQAIWGLPKELASFSWHADGVTVTDGAGVILSVELGAARKGLPLPAVMPAIGRRTFFLVRFWAYLGLSSARVTHWSDRFIYGVDSSVRPAVVASPFRATIAAPRDG
jgi:acetoacetate decarboxylase